MQYHLYNWPPTHTQRVALILDEETTNNYLTTDLRNEPSELRRGCVRGAFDVSRKEGKSVYVCDGLCLGEEVAH